MFLQRFCSSFLYFNNFHLLTYLFLWYFFLAHLLCFLKKLFHLIYLLLFNIFLYQFMVMFTIFNLYFFLNFLFNFISILLTVLGILFFFVEHNFKFIISPITLYNSCQILLLFIFYFFIFNYSIFIKANLVNFYFKCQAH